MTSNYAQICVLKGQLSLENAVRYIALFQSRFVKPAQSGNVEPWCYEDTEQVCMDHCDSLPCAGHSRGLCSAMIEARAKHGKR